MMNREWRTGEWMRGFLGTTAKPVRIAVAAGFMTLLFVGVTAGGFGVVATVNGATRTSALTDNRESAARLVTARIQDVRAIEGLDEALAAGAALDVKVTGFITAAPGVVDPAALADLESARAKLATTVNGIAKDRSVDLTTGLPTQGAVIRPVVKAPVVNAKSDTRFIVAATKALDTLTGNAKGSTKGSSFLIATINASTAAVTTSVTAVVTSVAAFGEARLAATPSAGAPERDAVVAAIAGVKDNGKALDTLIAYTVTMTAVKVSHDAFEASKAAEAAAAALVAQAAADAVTRNSGGGSSAGSGGYTSGGGIPSGGPLSGGGSPSVGGAPSSGGAQPPAALWRPIQVGTSFSSGCSGAGGSQEVSYGSTLNPPTNAFSVSTYELPGYGWGVTWTCDTGW